MQVPAEKRIKVADTLRLLFHYCNIVNLTLGLIVLGVSISLIVSPLPLPAGKEVSSTIRLSSEVGTVYSCCLLVVMLVVTIYIL